MKTDFSLGALIAIHCRSGSSVLWLLESS